MSAATADANVTASAANKTWIFKRKVQWLVGNTRGSLAAVYDYCHRAGEFFRLTTAIFLLKIGSGIGSSIGSGSTH